MLAIPYPSTRPLCFFIVSVIVMHRSTASACREKQRYFPAITVTCLLTLSAALLKYLVLSTLAVFSEDHHLSPEECVEAQLYKPVFLWIPCLPFANLVPFRFH